jgi:hypothetical protein
MANGINWGRIYCLSWWGDVDDTTDAIFIPSAPTCWISDVLELSVDSTAYKVDTILITADQTLI